MDNLVHASANEADAEREVKLWFRPDEIMPYMRAYPTEVASKLHFYKDGQLLTQEEAGASASLLRATSCGHLTWTRWRTCCRGSRARSRSDRWRPSIC